MTTFESLAKLRRDLVRTHRENNFQVGIRSLLSDLYPDNAHFIYELLQNAEDVGATEVNFVLDESQLVVTHNGTRSFSLEDIENITTIGESTKSTDETTIGKFGVGFKAVFGYTKSPKVRSGDFAFVIEDLWVPVAIEGRAPAGVTEFTFPFNEPKKQPEFAVAEISKALNALDASSLLFLNSIEKVTFRSPNGGGALERIQEEGNHRIRIQHTAEGETREDDWYRIRDTVQVDANGESKTVTVAAAFHLTHATEAEVGNSEPTATAPRLRIEPLPQGQVCIYFPAVKETSGLRFNVHAPFASTVARDSVRDDPANLELVKAIAHMVAASLPDLRDDGLLDDGLLEALPNTQEQIPTLYLPIREAVINAFRDGEFTPVYGGGGLARARDLMTSPQFFRGALDLKDLAFLAERVFGPQNPPYRWAAERTGRAGQFLAGLEMRQFSWDELSKALAHFEADYNHRAASIRLTAPYSYPVLYHAQPASHRSRAAWEHWLTGKPHAKLRDFYGLLGEAIQEGRMYAHLSQLPIIRRESGNGHKHVLGTDAYLPGRLEAKGRRFVPADLVPSQDDRDASRLRKFYAAAGARTWDEEAQLERVLRLYDLEHRPNDRQHFKDIAFFTQYIRKNPDAWGKFRRLHLVKALDPSGTKYWCRPQDVFVDAPFQDTGLASLAKQDPFFQQHVLWPGYMECPSILDLLRQLGSVFGLQIQEVSVQNNEDFRSAWVVNANRSAYTKDVDFTIPHFRNAVHSGNIHLLGQIWDLVKDADVAFGKALYQFNSNHAPHHLDSTVFKLLTTVPWVLDRDGNTRLPPDVGAGDLAYGLEPPSGQGRTLLHEVGFGSADAAQKQQSAQHDEVARGLGISPEAASQLYDALAGKPADEVAALIEELSQRASVATVPDQTAPDPDRRRNRAAQDAAEIPFRAYAERIRRDEVDRPEAIAVAKAYLRTHYGTADGTVICQVCRKPMPFKVQGNDYFEAVELLKKGLKLYHQNRLALCPLCAAMYKFANETDLEALQVGILASQIDSASTQFEFEVRLAGNAGSIVLTAKHIIDLQGAFRDNLDSQRPPGPVL